MRDPDSGQIISLIKLVVIVVLAVLVVVLTVWWAVSGLFY
jgi:flagellar basal body-associated protein FliL